MLDQNLPKTKICQKCNKRKEILKFKKEKKNKNGTKIIYIDLCDTCELERKKEYVKKVQEGIKYKEYQKSYQKKLREENPQEYSKMMGRYQRKYIDQLSDSYIRNLLKKSGYSKSQIEKNPGLILEKRKQIQIFRKNKNKRSTFGNET